MDYQFSVVVNVRKDGSIGIFEPMSFTVLAPSESEARTGAIDRANFSGYETRGTGRVTVLETAYLPY